MSYGHRGVGGEVPLSQCDKCGSEVPPEEIDWEMKYNISHILKALFVGIVIGGFFRMLFTWIQLG